MKKSIGMNIENPKKSCDDQKCPFHGDTNVKDESQTGIVVKKDVHNTATIEWERRIYIPKYERYQKKKSRMRVHNPPCIDAKIGDKVLALRTRPISKTKNFIIVKITKKSNE